MPLPYWLKPSTNRTNLIGWDIGSTATLVLLAAGHPAGLYEVGGEVIIRAVGTGGSFTKRYRSSVAGTLRATADSSSGTLLALGRCIIGAAGNFNTSWIVMSDGTQNIDCVVTPASPTGTPLIDLFQTCRLISLG